MNLDPLLLPREDLDDFKTWLRSEGFQTRHSSHHQVVMRVTSPSGHIFVGDVFRSWGYSNYLYLSPSIEYLNRKFREYMDITLPLERAARRIYQGTRTWPTEAY